MACSHSASIFVLKRLITARLPGLEPGDRRWLERLAIVGGRITPDFLVAAFPPTERREADEVLAHLTRLGWIVRREPLNEPSSVCNSCSS